MMPLWVVRILGTILVASLLVVICLWLDSSDHDALSLVFIILAILSLGITPLVIMNYYDSNFVLDDTISSYPLVDKDSMDYVGVSSARHMYPYVVYKDEYSVKTKRIDLVYTVVIDDDSEPRLEYVNTHLGKIKSKSWVLHIQDGY